MRFRRGVTVRGPRKTGWQRSLVAKSVLVTALPAVALIGAISGLLAVERQAALNDAAVARTVRIDGTAQHVLTLLVDSETGVRGYVATGSRTFLEPEVSARAELPAALAQLSGLLNSQSESASAAQIKALAAQELADLQSLENLRSIQPPDRDAYTQLALMGKQTWTGFGSASQVCGPDKTASRWPRTSSWPTRCGGPTS